MADDLFQDLLGLEDGFYQEGYDAGIADSAYAGMIEGKVFGIEKGYEKAFELARLHGRGLVWQSRLATKGDGRTLEPAALSRFLASSEPLTASARLQKNIDNLLDLTDAKNISPENTDEAVSEFDERVAKARAKAKIIANTVGEALTPAADVNRGIEDATGLKARH